MARKKRIIPTEPDKVTKPVEEQDVMRTNENGELVDGIDSVTVVDDKKDMPDLTSQATTLNQPGLAGERKKETPFDNTNLHVDNPIVAPASKAEELNPSGLTGSRPGSAPEGTEGTQGTEQQPKEETYDDILKSFEDLHRSRLTALEQEEAAKSKRDSDAQLYGGLTEVLASIINLGGTAHGAQNQAFTSQQDKFYERAYRERAEREARREKYTSQLQSIRMQRAQLRASNALKQQELAMRMAQQADLNAYRQRQLDIQSEKADTYNEYQIARTELTQKLAELKELEKDLKKAQTAGQKAKTQSLIDKTKKEIEKQDATIKDIQQKTALNRSRQAAQDIKNQQALYPDQQPTLPSVDEEFEV